MNFFEQQAQARQRTVWLVCGFVLGLLLVVYCTYVLASWAVPVLLFFGHEVSVQAPQWCAAGAALLIGLGAALGWSIVDGAALARNMGASALPLTSADPDERRCLQVVQEMAIAAGCPVPGIYVFEDAAINAFAAGGTPQTAVIALSRGALSTLARDELQAVVAHEFSHIFNGDMRLNMRMLGALTGLMLIGVAGQVMWQRRSAQNLALGAVLMVVGALGLIVAQLIKAAVARQREYLADASAIQFTRNPAGLYGALRKVRKRGSLLLPLVDESPVRSDSSNMLDWVPNMAVVQMPAAQAQKQVFCAKLMSHFFFAPAYDSAFDGWLATHPSLQDRLQAIDANGLLEFEYLQRSKSGQIRKAVRQDNPPPHFSDAAPIPLALPEAQASGPGTPAAELINTDIASALRERIPDYLKQRLEYAAGAAAVVQGLLLSAKPFVRQAQRDILIEHSNAVVAEAALQAQAHMMNLPQVLRLPFLNLAIPALRKLMPQEQEVFLKTVNFLVLADGKVNAFELMAQVLLQHNLRPESIVLAPGTAAQHIRLTLSYLAYCGARGQAQAAHQSYQYALGKVPGLRLREMLSLQDCEPQAVRRSVLALAGLRPLEKQNFVAAVQACAMHDAVVYVSEWEIVRVLCQCLEVHCPLAPPGLQVGAFIS
jgi:Zn-dependent protease with chaperone function